MHRYWACLVFAAIAFETHSAQGSRNENLLSQGFMNGNRLYWQLTSPETERKAYGASYIAGVHDAVSTMQSVQAVPERICAPYGATPEQLGDVVKEYLERNPERRHQSAAANVVLALRGAFPCTQSPSKPQDDELNPRPRLIPG